MILATARWLPLSDTLGMVVRMEVCRHHVIVERAGERNRPCRIVAVGCTENKDGGHARM